MRVLSLSTCCVWGCATTCGAWKKCEGTSLRGTLILSTEVTKKRSVSVSPKNRERIPSHFEVSAQITFDHYFSPSHDVWSSHPDSSTTRHQSKIGAWWSGCCRGWRWVGMSILDYIKGVIYCIRILYIWYIFYIFPGFFSETFTSE